MARILFLTSSQPSINPRLRKSADAHAHAGHQVHVLYYRTLWADVNDDLILIKLYGQENELADILKTVLGSI